MPDSILKTTKTALGLADDYDAFDSELIIHINSVLADMNQLGVGPLEGFTIENDEATWEDFMGADKRYSAAKSYMYFAVRMLFDQPSTAHAISAYQKEIEKMEWRLNIQREEIDHPAET